MTPKVSVLMPAYNGELYLKESIESILNQSFADFEFIIIDDGSTDSSWGIIQEYAKKDTRIVAVKNEKNLWISGIRNKLLSHAKSKYIVWQDADDISLSYRIEKQYEYMEAHPEAWICGWWLQFFDISWDTSRRLYKETDEEVRKTIFRYSPVSQGASMYRTKAIKNVWGYDESLLTAEDLDLSFRIGTEYQFWNIQEIVLKYRQHNSDTFKNLKKMELTTLKIRWENHRKWNYKMTFWDKLYNRAQLISVYIIPTKWKIRLFNFIRNK